jgi:hypothetical protein
MPRSSITRLPRRHKPPITTRSASRSSTPQSARSSETMTPSGTLCAEGNPSIPASSLVPHSRTDDSARFPKETSRANPSTGIAPRALHRNSPDWMPCPDHQQRTENARTPIAWSNPASQPVSTRARTDICPIRGRDHHVPGSSMTDPCQVVALLSGRSAHLAPGRDTTAGRRPGGFAVSDKNGHICRTALQASGSVRPESGA